MAADSVRKTDMGLGKRMLIKSAVRFYNYFFRRISPHKTSSMPARPKGFQEKVKNLVRGGN